MGSWRGNKASIVVCSKLEEIDREWGGGICGSGRKMGFDRILRILWCRLEKKGIQRGSARLMVVLLLQL